MVQGARVDPGLGENEHAAHHPVSHNSRQTHPGLCIRIRKLRT